MKFFKFLACISLSIALFYVLNNRLILNSTAIPPLGKFLNPYEGFWQNAESTPLTAPEKFNINTLQEEVLVKYDSNFIPHIFAENDPDLYTAAGYVAAFHRLWQIELVTHNAAGRLSEIIGPATIPLDQEQRRIGMVWSAKRVIEEWKKYPEIYDMLTAYANGVNAYIDRLSYRDLPLEYKLLDYSPEKWTPYKSALVLKYMSKMLTIGESDMENTNFVNQYGFDLFNKLFPDFPEEIDPIIPGEKKWDFENDIKFVESDTFFQSPALSSIFEKPYPGLGSNNWAIGASKSENGNAFLANDMHLNLNLPSIWFVVQYHTPEMNVFGHILPGTPMVIQGFNDSIAWGMTNAYRDLVDWYKITFKNEYRKEYLYDDNWLLTQQLADTIKVRGAEDIIDTIIFTHQGPIAYDEGYMGSDQKANLAMRWLAHDVSFEPLCFFGLAKANNYDDFKEAISYFSCPPQNLVFADVKGNTAIHVQGKYPIKYPHQGKFILDGSTSRSEWAGIIPPEENPQIFNPTRGFVSSANQHPVDESYPYYVYADNNEYYRNRRINNVLNEKDSLKFEDLALLQTDDYSIYAEELLPILIDSVKFSQLTKSEKEVVSELKKWDYNYGSNEVGPAFFEIWQNELYSIIWDELIDSKVPMPLPSTFQTVWLMKNNADLEFFDVTSTDKKETLNDLIVISLEKTAEQIAKWKADHPGEQLTRANYYHTKIMHYAQINAFSQLDLKVGGSGDAVNATTTTHGPSERIIVEMGTPVKAWHTYPGGQSGNPGNPHYTRFLDSWMKGTYFPVHFYKSKGDYTDQTIFTQTLSPN